MVQYIDKLKVVSEINKHLADILACIRDASVPEERIALTDTLRLCKDLLSFLDSIDVEFFKPENIWHNYNDQIDVDKTILIIAPNGNSSLALWNGKALLSKTLGGGHNVLCEGDKWAYIEDLIKTQKVV